MLVTLPAFLSIRLDQRDGECIVCGEYLPSPRFGVPMYEGQVLPNNWTGEWAGFDACEACFRAQEVLTEPVESSQLRSHRT